MLNPYEKLAKAFHMDEYDLERDLSRNFGMSFRGNTIYVKTGKKKHRIGAEDVIRYYVYEAGNLSSGCRTIAGITGDWRPIDYLAKQCLEIYKVLKKEELKRICKKYDIQPKGW